MRPHAFELASSVATVGARTIRASRHGNQFYHTIRIWLPIYATMRASRHGMQPHAFELVSMVATIGNQHEFTLPPRLRPSWNATARLRACLDGGRDRQPEPASNSGNILSHPENHWLIPNSYVVICEGLRVLGKNRWLRSLLEIQSCGSRNAINKSTQLIRKNGKIGCC